MSNRLRLVGQQWSYVWISYPGRLFRWLQALGYPLIRRYTFRLGPVDYIMHLMLLSADLIMFPELYMTVVTLLKPSCRALQQQEVDQLASVYGTDEVWGRVVVDDRSRILTRKYAFAYVSWHMINYWQRLSAAVLIHEYLHVLQYQRLGSVYIYEALKAQRSKQGYDYGGPALLHQRMMMGGQLADLNLEQQAEVMEDVYKHLRHGVLPPAYAYYARQVKDLYVA